MGWETLNQWYAKGGGLMSKGLGSVAKQLRTIFLDEPPKFYPTTVLCQLVYNVSEVEKKHRVSVLRAMKTLAERNEVNIWRLKLRLEKTDDEWFNGSRILAPKNSMPLRKGTLRLRSVAVRLKARVTPSKFTE
jgi:hypothetical protein